MSTEAADQALSMSLKSLEVIVRLGGSGIKNLSTFLYAAIRSKNKSKGKGRLSSMLNSGKELKVFSVRTTDLKTFKEYAKKYGVLYCVVKDKNDVDKMSDIIVRAEDAAKINRIIERFQFADVRDTTKATESPVSEQPTDHEDTINKFVNAVLGEEKDLVPQQTTEQEPPSDTNLDTEKNTKKSVRADLFEIKKEVVKKETDQVEPVATKGKGKNTENKVPTIEKVKKKKNVNKQKKAR